MPASQQATRLELHHQLLAAILFGSKQGHSQACALERESITGLSHCAVQMWITGRSLPARWRPACGGLKSVGWRHEMEPIEGQPNLPSISTLSSHWTGDALHADGCGAMATRRSWMTGRNQWTEEGLPVREYKWYRCGLMLIICCKVLPEAAATPAE